MSNRKLQIILISMLVLLTLSTIAYAYVGPDLGSRILRYGMIGGDVQDLQNRLNTNGYSVGFADWIFGLKTLSGVKNFQKNNGLTVDGIVGPLTLGKLVGTNAGYTVKAGDTLYKISLRNGLTIDQLKAANRLTSDLIYPGQVLTIPSGSSQSSPPAGQPAPANKPLKQILTEKGITGQIPNLKIVVDKSSHILTLYSGAAPLKTYPISLGDSGLGDKVKAGDHKTPEGQFYISERSILTPADEFLGSRWLRISYPNKEDADRGLAAGLIDQATHDQIYAAINSHKNPPQNTALGGGIGIHGGVDNNGTNDWTWGCMALNENDVHEIFDYIGVGTSLYIQR